MTTNHLKITNASGENLACVEVKPPQSHISKFPIVILCHGFAYVKEESNNLFIEIAKRLASKGYAVYYFDFSGCGESEGNYENTTLTKLVDDLRVVHKKVSSFDYNDSNKVSLIGQSFGTNVAITAQIYNLERMVLCGSFENPHKILSALFPDFNENGVSIRQDSREFTTIGPQFWQDLRKYSIIELIKKLSCPILFIHAGNDTIVPLENMRPLLAAAKNSAGVEILEKSDHGLMPEQEQALIAIEKFFPLANKYNK